ncbi:MAG: glycosyltransferase family 2 protein [Syntrophaceae bacterium]|nr:glycosyltransferase family 2 protein [Syntrophaceae bacterium]
MILSNSAGVPISVAVITRNEEDRLPACLESLGFADEVVVVDSGSADRTVERARALGARVMIEPWRGFSAQKQFAVDRCSYDWVLILDADERVPLDTSQTIKRALSEVVPEVNAYSFKRKNYLDGHWIKHCGWWPDRVVRLVNREKGRFDGRPVHEKWLPQGRVVPLDAFIEHASFRNYSDLVVKMEHYSNLTSKDLFDRGVHANALTPLIHGLWMFLKTYLWELGFLEGFDGMLISTMNAGGSFLKYAKLMELAKTAARENQPDPP